MCCCHRRVRICATQITACITRRCPAIRHTGICRCQGGAGRTGRCTSEASIIPLHSRPGRDAVGDGESAVSSQITAASQAGAGYDLPCRIYLAAKSGLGSRRDRLADVASVVDAAQADVGLGQRDSTGSSGNAGHGSRRWYDPRLVPA